MFWIFLYRAYKPVEVFYDVRDLRCFSQDHTGVTTAKTLTVSFSPSTSLSVTRSWTFCSDGGEYTVKTDIFEPMDNTSLVKRAGNYTSEKSDTHVIHTADVLREKIRTWASLTKILANYISEKSNFSLRLRFNLSAFSFKEDTGSVRSR